MALSIAEVHTEVERRGRPRRLSLGSGARRDARDAVDATADAPGRPAAPLRPAPSACAPLHSYTQHSSQL